MTGKPNSLIWAPKADDDLLAIWDYYSIEASDETADKVVGQIIAAARRVAELPFSGRARDDLKTGTRSVLSHPYIVFYRRTDNGAQILRVLHERRNLAAELSKPE